ncbi:MAG: molybdenum cofactor biosynthesis protein B [Candidatus Binatia bacterium]
MSTSHHGHDAAAVECGILTVSDTRTEADDHSGQRIRALLEERGHRVTFYRIVKDEPEQIGAVVRALPGSVTALICNGGTGIAKRDTTYEAITRLLEKEITGFGELFRMLSWEQVGAAAMLSRATAGIAGSRAIFSLPGSTKAVELAMTKLILPQLGHVVGLVREGRCPAPAA